jgi:hypothetical protein
VSTVKAPYQAPNANAHSERYVRSCKNECLNHLLIFGLNRLQYVVDRYASYFNDHRPHQGLGNKVPAEYGSSIKQLGSGEPFRLNHVVCRNFLGGLLKSYQRAA